MYDKLIFKLSKEGRNTTSLPDNNYGNDIGDCIDKRFLRNGKIALPEVAEIDVLRHFINLSYKNHNILKGFYPLGSCTMKYNPIINEEIASNEKLLELHPYQDEEDIQGALQIMYELQEMLMEISGYAGITLMPVAGAHSEFTGMMMMREYFLYKKENRKKILIPDSAHGTNPASCTLAGFIPVQIKSNINGEIDLNILKEKMDNDTVGIMMTNPNTLGVFETHFDEIAEIVHSKGGLVYMDGANLNALMGIVKPGQIGADILHFNLHKTFSTPHGGGGPGAGGIAVIEKLRDFLPPDIVVLEDGQYGFKSPEHTIERLHAFYGNFNVMVKAWAYIKIMGKEGIKEASEMAIINANYLKKNLEDIYDIPFKSPVLHEFVISGKKHKLEYNVSTLDIAKRILDFDMHAPTIYFPLIVSEAIMIEPTETESKETLDKFIEIMKIIDREAKENKDVLKNAPSKTPVGRLNEIKALKDFNVNYYMENNV